MSATPPPEGAAGRLRRVLEAAGLPAATPLVPVPSSSNEVWLGADLALRVNTRGDGSLGREAALGRQLPAAVRYPGVLDHGHLGPLEWILTRRVPGVPLAHAWPDLSTAARRSAIEQLAGVLRALHAAELPGAPTDRDLDGPHVLPVDRMVEQIRRVARGPHVEARMIEACLDRVRTTWSAFEAPGGEALVHGDLHLENVLWSAGRITALLDLEWTRRSWREVDLEILLAFCGQPRTFVAEGHAARLDGADFRHAPGWLRAAYPALFEHPRREERLTLLGLSRAFGLLADHPPTREVDPADRRDPRARIEALLTGRVCWMDPP